MAAGLDMAAHMRADDFEAGVAMKIEYLDTKIRYFLKIAETGSLSKAAEELGIGQSGLSRQLAMLESFVRKPLFVRTGRGVKLTDAGEKLQLETRSRYEKIDIALMHIRDKHGITEGHLRIASIHTLGSYFVSDLLGTFIGRQGRVNLSITAGGSPDVVELVEKRKVDIGFAYDSAVASDLLESTPLFEDTMCVIIQRQDADDQTGMNIFDSQFPLIGFPETFALRNMIKTAGLDSRVIAEANTLEAMLRLVASGIGRCILPNRIPEEVLAEYNLVKIPLTAPVLKRRVVAIIRRNGAPLLANQLFEMAKSVAKSGLA
ncbi:LysR family transcriptional regulator [Castellaniella sp. S9]|uniref:LysR family transcriptional regulator n=1 Tax=Castellaniella sp. S9 TaxID=2993652 RepID=UPI0022B54F47|nr:LysR family transcriptional regulator [Castellaniella sp. S9]